MITGAPSSAHCRAIREDTPNAAPISFQPCAKLAEVREMNVSCLSIVGLSVLRRYHDHDDTPSFSVSIQLSEGITMIVTPHLSLLALSFWLWDAGYPAIAHMPRQE